jgi:cholesterol oxidase
MDCDVLIIGSGFGGAITACRLAEKGAKVRVLERGHRWDKTTYPRKPEDEWIWSREHPERYHGWADLRRFDGMAVIAGAGVGGGSLIYANVSAVPPPSVFDSGWPREITYAAMQPYYATVADMLDVQRVPENQWSPRVRLMREAAAQLGQPERFRPIELAVSFDPKMTVDFDVDPDIGRSTRFTNKHGAPQGYCAHLAECDIGCRADAKNTLDKNYLYLAEQRHGAEIRALHLVTGIEPVSGGYRVHHDELKDGTRISGSSTAASVVVAAGSMGSTELLLQCRDVHRTLPRLSPTLGHRWSSNGDFLTPALYLHKTLWADRGPTIGAVIDYLDGSDGGQTYWIQDGGTPNVLNSYFEAIVHRLRESPTETHLLPWFAQGVDAGDGELHLTDGVLDLKWDITRSLGLFETIEKRHHTLAHATGGHPFPLPTWLFSKELVTPHPLGGCNMGDTVDAGVVNHSGEVFGYENLYVADGAIVPRAVGVNPSRTIGALAERIAECMTR